MIKFNAKAARAAIDTARKEALEIVLSKLDAQLEEASKNHTSLPLKWTTPECWKQEVGLFNTTIRAELFKAGYRMDNMCSIGEAGSFCFGITVYW